MRWLSYTNAAGHDGRWLRAAEAAGVSEVARSARGFMSVYARAGSAAATRRVPFSATQTWGQRRDNFVRRHLAQYEKNPTPKRALALRMWAYDTGDGMADSLLLHK